MTLFHDLMIDVESIGLPPTGALLSLGAVFFNTEAAALGPEYNAIIHLGSAMSGGGTADASTIIFWLGQSDEARNTVRFGGRHINEVLQEFSDWITQTCRHADVRPWGNSARFDLTLVEGAYKRAGITVPWHWVNERCFRTTRNQYPQVVYDPKEKGEGAHNALEDAKFQARHLFKIKHRNKGNPWTTKS